MAGKRGPRLLERVRRLMQTRRYSPRTIKTYTYWMRYYIRYHHHRHPERMGAAEVRDFLTWLAVERSVAASSRNRRYSVRRQRASGLRCTGGQGTSPKEQNTQQSPDFGLSISPQPAHS